MTNLQTTAEIYPPVHMPEAEVLLCCARVEMTPQHQQKLEQLLSQEEIHWSRVLEMAHVHGVSPLLDRHLANLETGMSPMLRQDLRQHVQETARRNVSFTGELIELLQTLEEQGVVVAPYKGPVLAAAIYGNIALREFADLDIIIRPVDVRWAQDALLTRGYQPWNLLSPEQEAHFLRSNSVRRFVRPNSYLAVDLHWGLTFSWQFAYPLDAIALWDRLQEVQLAGKTIHTIPDEEVLQFLCIHGARHFWQRLIWICDVAELLRMRPDLNWQQVWEQVKRTGNTRILLLGLYLAHHLLDAPLPESATVAMAEDPALPELATMVYNHWLFPEIPLSGLSEKLATRRFILGIRERWRERLPLAIYYYLVTPLRLFSGLPARLMDRGRVGDAKLLS